MHTGWTPGTRVEVNRRSGLLEHRTSVAFPRLWPRKWPVPLHTHCAVRRDALGFRHVDFAWAGRRFQLTPIWVTGHRPLAIGPLREQERDRVVSAACPYLLIHCNTLHLKARFAFTTLPGRATRRSFRSVVDFSTTVTCPAVVNFKSAIALPPSPLLPPREIAEISANMAGFLHKLNTAVAGSIAGRYFRLEGSGHVRTIVG